MKKAGKAAGKPAGKPGAKAGPSNPKPASKVSGSSSPDVLLYAFKSGTITTCLVPSMKLQQHAQTFPKHRCGYFNSKLYLLEENRSHYAIASDALRELGTLKVYNPRSHTIDATIQTCKCNFSTLPLFVKGNELIDLGLYPRLITVATGQREPITVDSRLSELSGVGACFVLNKTIIAAGGEYDPENLNFKGMEEAEDMEGMQPGGVYSLTCAGFKFAQVAPDFSPALKNASVVPLSASEFLLLGEQNGTAGMVAYRYKTNEKWVQREGGLRRSLGQCFSSTIIDNVVYLLFDSGVIGKCDLRSGLMRVCDLGKFEKLKTLLWTISKTPYCRLPQGLKTQELAQYLLA